ncbi:MAG: hypothetical protein WCQ50_05545 [Spirochaetota bacterium]
MPGGRFGIALVLMAVGMITCFPDKKWIKRDIPDVDPHDEDTGEA